jgi:acid phosphatase (class A)
MTKTFLFLRAYVLSILIVLVFSGISFSQQLPQKGNDVVPPRGHYAALWKLDREPRKENSDWDARRFPFDAASAEKRLSLKPYYLQNVSENEFAVPAPPANSSEQTRAELNYLLQLQQQRTKIDVDASLEMAGIYYSVRITPSDPMYNQMRKNLFFIGRSIGTWFHPDSLPVTANFMAHVWQDASYFIWSFKYKYARVRPYKLDDRLSNLEETEWPAYPSGHATNSYVNAFIYQELAPEFYDVFIKDAYDMAHSREIIGVHYPSDSESGRIIARQMVNMLFKNEKFLKDLQEVKKEWASKSNGYYGPVDVNKSTVDAPKKSCGAPAQASGTACKTD